MQQETTKLSTGPAGEYCPLCSTKQTAWRHPKVCGRDHAPVLLSWQWQSESDYENWYKDPTAYHVDEQAANGQKPFAECYGDHQIAASARLDMIQPYLADAHKPPYAMDVGTGTGAFVVEARNRGIAAEGIEPCNEVIAFDARRYIFGSTWKDVTQNWLDLVHASDIFEHLTRPREFLAQMKSAISHANGLIVIETPEWNGPDQLRAGWDWKHIRPRQHVCLYSREAAEQMYLEAGLEVVAFWRPLRGSIGKMTHVLQVAR